MQLVPEGCITNIICNLKFSYRFTTDAEIDKQDIDCHQFTSPFYDFMSYFEW